MCIVVLSTFIFGEGVGFPGTRVINSYELPRGEGGLSAGPLEEQPRFFLLAEPSLQPMDWILTPKACILLGYAKCHLSAI